MTAARCRSRAGQTPRAGGRRCIGSLGSARCPRALAFGEPGANHPESHRAPLRSQKPLKLMERIIRASSNEGELVLDPFCGCGTTIHAAKNLGRKWVGIDISSFAIDIIRTQRLKDKTIPAHGIPQDLASARKMANVPRLYTLRRPSSLRRSFPGRWRASPAWEGTPRSPLRGSSTGPFFTPTRTPREQVGTGSHPSARRIDGLEPRDLGPPHGRNEPPPTVRQGEGSRFRRGGGVRKA